ncbi:zinc transporter ZIP10 isoform X2 [Thalassophryne amazonica]|uniref:zinc transporter ZIP10 isoform X2 n=1 Tax=Thalassophryne amazonica TaxID=390379 RepID=UPI001470FB8C|nr:zinc transporter ZIP10 isoform X2 [Thalassophryne amazonica]
MPDLCTSDVSGTAAFWYRAERSCTRHSSEVRLFFPSPPQATATTTLATMRVHVHTKFCFLCVLTFLFHQCTHCHEEGRHQHSGHHHTDHGQANSDIQISEAPYMRGATLLPDSRSSQGDMLEEQHFYIRQLFKRYGQKDRLDFQGFQNLLFSLGLGEVKVVGLDHKHFGHDHVAHLDLLDMQEGLHSHSSTNENQSYEHRHKHSHPRHMNNAHHPHTDQVSTNCNKQTTDASPTAFSLPEHEHNYNYDSHDPNHKRDADHDYDATKDSDSWAHGHGKEHTHEYPKDHPTQSYHGHDHSGREYKHHGHLHHMQMSTDVPGSSREQLDSGHIQPSLDLGEQHTEGAAAPVPAATTIKPPPVPTDIKPKKLRKPTKVRGHRGRNKTSHSQKQKREAPVGPATPTLSPALSSSGHPDGVYHQHEECLNLTQLLTDYGLNPESVISPSQFTYLCPALLYQIDSRVCILHYHQMDVEQEALEPVSSVWVWVWGFVSISIISLLSLLGVVLVPILNQSCFKFLLTFLVALAVGTLSGDALLHLLPHSQGQHNHDHDHDHNLAEMSHDTDLVTDFDGVWKGLTALAGIYLLFIIEHCIGMFKHYKDQAGMTKVTVEGKIGRKLSDHKLNRRSDAEWLHLKPLNEDPDSTTVSCDNSHNNTQLTELQTPDSPTNTTPLAPAEARHTRHHSPVKENGHKAKKHRHRHSHGHAHGGNCHSDQEMKDAGIASIAWMVIMGDGMHNFSDGLAIGAAFSANLTGGISTSVAVFCHELPHELGDFAVLLKAGMSVKQAIVYNVLSALMAYVGMLIGTAVGQYTYNVTNWIFAITAGMFLYVALVDMLPEMLHGDSEDHKRCQLGHFFLQNVGMLTGFGIMLLIAIFEDRIVFDFGF